MESIEIGKRIGEARKLRGATLDDIATKIGVAKSTIQRYENGKIVKIKLPVVESIALALNVNPSWIVGKSNIMERKAEEVPIILKYYNMLNDIGKHEATKRVSELTNLPQYVLNAAHSIPNSSKADIEHDENIMDSDDF